MCRNKYNILRKNSDYFNALIKLLDDKEPWIRLNVVLSLKQLGDERAVTYLIKLLREENNEFVKAAIIKSLARLGSKKILPIILPFLKDSDYRVVANTIEAIEILGDSSFIDHIKPFLNSDSIRIKVNTAKALWYFGIREVLGILIDMLNSDMPNIRDSVVYALSEINTPAARDALCKHLINESDDTIRLKIVKILGKIGDEYCIPALRNMLSDKSIRIAKEAQIAISNIKERCGEYQVCKKCGSINAANANFCSSCGKVL